MNSARLLFTFYLLFFTFYLSFAQRGKDGAKVISTANNVVNEYTTLTANAAAGATAIAVASGTLNANGRFPGNLAAGDLLLLIQIQGAEINGVPPFPGPPSWSTFSEPRDSTWGYVLNYHECGNWEFAEVYSISGTTITLDCPLTNTYTAAGRVLVVRVPRYSSLTVNGGGSITCDPWNGSIGGVCAMEVQNNTTINAGGSIDVTGKGFRSELLEDSAAYGIGPDISASLLQSWGAEKGEGIAGYAVDYDIYGGRYCRGAGANSGGGGNGHNAGGGGGANGGNPLLWNGHGNPDNSIAGWTTAWNLQWPGFSANTSSGGGQGGYSFSNANKNPTTTPPNNTSWTGDNRNAVGGYGGRPLDYSTGRLFLGGAGGSGDQNDNEGGKGGTGGALIYLMNYGTISGAGQFISNGTNGTNSSGTPAATSYAGTDGSGGGGAGGTVLINSVGTISGISITANGGKGGNQAITKGAFYVSNGGKVYEAEGPGGGGGGGYIGFSNGAPAAAAAGGANGTTNSDALTLFPPNGATIGGAGTTNGTLTNFIINAPNVTICAGQSATLTATLSGTVPNGTTIIWYDQLVAGNTLGTGNTYTTSVLTAGTYTYYVGTCPGTYHQPVIVTVTSSPLVSAGPDVTICNGGNTTLAASGGSAYVWSPSTGLNNPNISNPVATPASTTTYICTVTTSCGNANDTVIVTVNSSLSASISGNLTICSGGNTTLTASGGNNYLWNNSATTSSIVVSPTATTTYSVTVTNGSCSSTTSATVIVSSTITASISGNLTICTGGNTTLTASGGNNYSWNNSATTSSIVVSPTVTTTYSVTVSNGNCSSTTSVTVIISSSITASVSGNLTICSGGSSTLTASGGNSFSWSTNATTSSIVVSPTATTTYSVTVTNGSCSSTTSVTVNVSSNLTATISGNNKLCSGGSNTLTASGGSNFSWSTGSTSSAIVISSAGNYSVTVSSGNCSSTTSFTVTNNPPISTTFTVNAINCGSSNGSIQSGTSGGTPGYTYSWNPTGQTNATATGLNAGGNYTLTVTDAIGCTHTATVNLTALNSPFASVSGNTLLCTGDATTLTAGGGTTYSWSTGSTATSIALTPTATSTYTLVAYTGNCTDTALVTVQVSPPPTASVASNTTVCIGSSATLTAGGNGTYSWNTGQTSSSIVVSPTSNSTYSVIVTIGSCSDSASATVSVIPTPTAAVTSNPASSTICGGDAITLTASGGNSYVWNNGATTASITVTPAATSTYTVSASNGFCTDTQTVTVFVLPPPVAGITGNTNICQGDSATLTATGGSGGTYLWNTGATTQTINTSASGTYSVVVTVGSCSDAASAVLNVNPLPTATVTPSFTIIEGESTTLTGGTGATYLWNTGENGASITVSPNATTHYCITVFDANGCRDSACMTLTVELCTGTPYLPTAFSPNGDGENDSLQLYYGIPKCITSFHLSIYNRWGEKVYETLDPIFRWSGIYNSGLLQNTQKGGTEVFAFYMDIVIANGTSISKKGNISLVR
ncbi:MAG: gliding motility-associated C-terminal domain-containing protein [Bacteroidetes bacterium]|nr:gliding motility-associated C-terminal domain-containing protein [Bacteroidota bacterium]